MKVWVTGSSGMLGSAVVGAASALGDLVIATDHKDCAIEDEGAVVQLLDNEKPDVVINCAGRVPGSGTPLDMRLSNTLGPLHLAQHCGYRGLRLVLVSTDCVFSGREACPRRRHTVTDLADPADAYGWSKLAGEIRAEHVLTVRTSFVGLTAGLGLWLTTRQKGKPVPGWTNAFWTGTSVPVIAQVLAQEAHGIRVGIHHAASAERVSKHWVLEQLNKILGLGLDLHAQSLPVMDRSLEPTIELPPLRKALERLKE